jgi:FkbM family methyltransferase
MFTAARFGLRLLRTKPVSPLLFLVRLAAWRVRSAVGWGATVDFPFCGARFYCPPEWRGTAKMAYVLREHCVPELSHLDQWVKRGDVVVDVGAHYGAYTIVLSRLVGAFGSVFAIEPSSHALSVLRRNIGINQLSNVEVIAAGVGEHSATGVLYMHSDPSRASLIAFSDGSTLEEPIKIVRLDDAIPGDRKVAFIKIDVEGYELLALRGARALLERDRPLVLFELLPAAAVRGGLPAYGVWEFLDGLGYRFKGIDPELGEITSVASPEHALSPNLIALP